jgi:hypothetical protein
MMKVRDFMTLCFNNRFRKLRKVRDICAAFARNLFIFRDTLRSGVFVLITSSGNCAKSETFAQPLLEIYLFSGTLCGAGDTCAAFTRNLFIYWDTLRSGISTVKIIAKSLKFIFTVVFLTIIFQWILAFDLFFFLLLPL